MKRVLTAVAVVFIAAAISVVVTGPNRSAQAQPITGGTPGGISRVHHSGAFYGLGTSGSNLDLRHDCSTGSGQTWDGSAWQCAAVGGGFTSAGSGLASSGSTVSLNATGCSTNYVLAFNGTGWTCQAQTGSGGGGSAGYGSGLGSGTIAVTITAMSTTVDLSTLGTIDWEWQGFVTLGTGALNCGAGGTNCHTKLTGGMLLANLGVQIINATATASFPTATIGVSSDTADDLTSTGMSATTSTDGLTKTTASYGIRFPLPSPGGNIQRVARIYVHAEANTVVCTGHALDSSAADAGSGNVLAGAATGDYEVKVTYTTNTAGVVNVNCIATVVNNTSSKLSWMATSLGPT